jgi:hypothetical protein
MPPSCWQDVLSLTALSNGSFLRQDVIESKWRALGRLGLGDAALAREALLMQVERAVRESR